MGGIFARGVHVDTRDLLENFSVKVRYAKMVGLGYMNPDEMSDLVNTRACNKVVNVGENIGMISLSDNPVKWMMKAFMDSPGHKAAILNADYKTIGIGFTVSEKDLLIKVNG